MIIYRTWKKNFRKCKIRQEYDFIEYKYISFIFDVQSLGVTCCSIYLTSLYLNNFLPSFQLYRSRSNYLWIERELKSFPRKPKFHQVFCYDVWALCFSLYRVSPGSKDNTRSIYRNTITITEQSLKRRWQDYGFLLVHVYFERKLVHIFVSCIFLRLVVSIPSPSLFLSFIHE